MASKKGGGNTAPTQNEQAKSAEKVEKKEENLQTQPAQIPIPDITVRIDKIFDDESKKLKAIASANIGPFAVHNIRIFENEKGRFINMPSVAYKDHKGNTQYDEVFHPVTKEAREALVKSVIDGYDQALVQSQNASQTPVPNHGSQTMQQM